MKTQVTAGHRVPIALTILMVITLPGAAACSGASAVRPGPPPPESCPPGTSLVCRETTASKMQTGNGKFCSCRQVQTP